ncbi:MAG: Hpt domain-containing protein, partial [Cyanobacteria bacterium J06648_11]
MEAAHLNWSRVEELRSEIGEDDFAEVVELFMSEADSAIARLNGELPDKNLEGTLHFLKGCMLN